MPVFRKRPSRSSDDWMTRPATMQTMERATDPLLARSLAAVWQEHSWASQHSPFQVSDHWQPQVLLQPPRSPPRPELVQLQELPRALSLACSAIKKSKVAM